MQHLKRRLTKLRNVNIDDWSCAAPLNNLVRHRGKVIQENSFLSKIAMRYVSRCVSNRMLENNGHD